MPKRFLSKVAAALHVELHVGNLDKRSVFNREVHGCLRQNNRACRLPPGGPGYIERLAPHLGKLAPDPCVDARRLKPTHRVFIGSAIGTKIRASYAHRSQRGAKPKGLGRLVPPWIAVPLLPFEYFTEA